MLYAVDGEQEVEKNYEEIVASPLSDRSPPPLPSVPRPYLSENFNQFSPPPLVNKPKLRPPIPPPKPPASDFIEDSAAYEDPNFISTEDHYSEATSNLLSESEEEIDDIEEDIYDGDISDQVFYILNKKPPPVWKPPSDKPPPLPPNRQKRYTKSMERDLSHTLDGTTFNFLAGSPPPLPPDRVPPKTKDQGSSRPLPMTPKKKPSNNSQGKSKPLPPVTPKKSTTSPKGRAMGFDIRNDLGRKLEQRRQEMSSGSSQAENKSGSWSEDDQLPYEEITYHGEDSPNSHSPMFNQRKPNAMVRISGEENEDGYVDMDPTTEVPQDYLDFETASQRTSQYLAEVDDMFPTREEDIPLPLPPRDIKPGNSRLSIQQRNTFRSNSPSSLEVPPPVPSRNVDDLISESFSEDEEEMAPPVPRRHPQASDRNKRLAQPAPVQERSRPLSPNNPLPLPPRSKSPVASSSPRSGASPQPPQEEDVAPPVPDRWARSTVDSRPPFDKPLSDARATRGTAAIAPERGISLPTGTSRLPQPPPKHSPGFKSPRKSSTTSEEGESIFEDVVFGQRSTLSPPRVTTDSQPHWKSHLKPHSNHERKSSSPLDSRPPTGHKPIPPGTTGKPKGTGNANKHKPTPLGGNTMFQVSLSPPPVSGKPKGKSPPPVPFKPKEKSPPPIATKPAPVTNGPATSRKPIAAPVTNSPATSRKPVAAPMTNFNGPATSRKPVAAPMTNGPATSRKPIAVPVTNGPATSRKPIAAPVTNGPATSRKPIAAPVTNGPATSRKPIATPVTNGPATSRKPIAAPVTASSRNPPPTAPKAKPVMKHLNNDLAALARLQNAHTTARRNDSSGSEDSAFQGNSFRNKRPVIPTKSKPLVPPKR